MKIKTWVVWLVVVVFLASEILLFSANRQKDKAVFALHAEQERADQLQAQLDAHVTANTAVSNSVNAINTGADPSK